MKQTSGKSEITDAVNRHFKDADIHIRGNEQYYAVVSCAKGGVIRVFDKISLKITYEDSGYILQGSRFLFTSQLIGLGHTVENENEDSIICETKFGYSRQEFLTPEKFVILQKGLRRIAGAKINNGNRKKTKFDRRFRTCTRS